MTCLFLANVDEQRSCRTAVGGAHETTAENLSRQILMAANVGLGARQDSVADLGFHVLLKAGQSKKSL